MLQTIHLSPRILIALAVCLILIAGLGLVGKVPIGYNLRNLLVRWRVTFLTALAFTLVVSLLTVMLSFVNGMNRLTQNSGQPGNIMVLSDGATDELFSNLIKSDTANIERQTGVLTTSDGTPLCSKEVYIVVNQQIPPQEDTASDREVRGKIVSISSKEKQFILADDNDKTWTFRLADDAQYDANYLKIDEKVIVVFERRGEEQVAREIRGSARRRFVQVRGIEDIQISSLVHGMELFPGGKWFSEAGVGELDGKASTELPPIQCVLGEGAARILGQDKKKQATRSTVEGFMGFMARLLHLRQDDEQRLEVGDHFELGPRRWVVTGIMQSAGSTFGSELWAKYSVVGPVFGKDQFTCLVLRTGGAGPAQTLADFLTTNHHPAVRAEPETVYYEKLSETNKQFSFAIYFVTMVMAIGGVFGVMNTMFAAISQRTKDIGVLRILGFARWQILVSFLLETITIALIGGLIGCALGSLCDGITATSVVSSGQGGGKTVVLKLTVDGNTIAIGILFTLVMGFLGGLIPALSAMRLRPLESLR